MQPYYDEGGITIYHGDCREILPLITSDAVLTDPPYGVQKASWDRDFMCPWDLLIAASPVVAVTPGVWNLAECPQRIGDHIYRWCLSAHLVNGMTRGGIGFGNWIPCMMWSLPLIKLHRPESDCRDFAVGHENKPEHDCPKPLNVMRWFLSRCPGGSVADPFMGSGTTLVAAKQLGRRGIGIEIEERYCELAAKRLAQGVLPLEACDG